MTASANAKPTFRPDNFPFRTTEKVRFADLDPLQHVNNAVYATYFESGRVALVHDPAHGLLTPGYGWSLARITINFMSEMHFPGDVEIGVGISRIGRTSIVFQEAAFSRNICAATCETVAVLIDVATRNPTPLPDNLIANFQRWIMPDLKG